MNCLATRRIATMLLAIAAAYRLAAMPLGARLASWSGESHGESDEEGVIALDAGETLDDLVLYDGTTLILTNGPVSAYSATIEGRIGLVLSSIPQDGKIVSLAFGGRRESGLSLTLGAWPFRDIRS